MLTTVIGALLAATQALPADAPAAVVQVDVYQVSKTQQRWLEEAQPADVARMVDGYRGARIRRLIVDEMPNSVNAAQGGNRVIGKPSSLTGMTGRLDDARGTVPVLTLTYSRLVARPDRITKRTRYTPFQQTDRPLTRVVRIDRPEQHFFTTQFNDPGSKLPMLVVVRRLPIAD